MTAYLKVGIAVALLVAAFGGGWLVRSWRDTSAAEALRADQLQGALTATQKALTTEHASVLAKQKVLDAYAAKPIDPVPVGLARRVYVYAAAAECRVMPQAGSVAGGAPAPAAIPDGDSSVVGRLQDVLDACTADAAQMKAMIAYATTP